MIAESGKTQIRDCISPGFKRPSTGHRTNFGNLTNLLDPRNDGRNKNRIPPNRHINGFHFIFMQKREGHTRSPGSTYFGYRLGNGPTGSLFIIYLENPVARSDSCTFGGRTLKRRNDDNSIFFEPELGTDAFKFSS